MKYYKRLDMWKASNVTFSPKTHEAISYGWWYFMVKSKGQLFFNEYRYSPSTSRHQTKIDNLLNRLGYNTSQFIVIETKLSLNNSEAFMDALNIGLIKINEQIVRINNKRVKLDNKKWAFKTLIYRLEQYNKLAEFLGKPINPIGDQIMDDLKRKLFPAEAFDKDLANLLKDVA